MVDPPFPVAEQLRRFGFAWDSVPGFGPHMDFWSFYGELVKAAPHGSAIVEIGCYHGRSLICLGLLAREADKRLQIVGVDNNDTSANATLKENLHRSGLASYVQFVELPSTEAALRFADGSCFAVFIDGAHLHDQVEADVRVWMPKVSHWLAGHDFFMYTVHQSVMALFGDRIIYDERWQDIWIVPKCEPSNEDIRTWRAALPPFNGWTP